MIVKLERSDNHPIQFKFMYVDSLCDTFKRQSDHYQRFLYLILSEIKELQLDLWEFIQLCAELLKVEIDLSIAVPVMPLADKQTDSYNCG